MRHDAANRKARSRVCARRARSALAWLVGAGLSGAAALAPASAKDVYTVAKLHVEATAEDAVAAKKTALSRGKKRALRIVLKRVAPFNSFDRLPSVGDDMVDDLLEGYSVRRERNSTTKYLATLDFDFSSEAVRQMLGGYGLPVADQQAPPVTVLPAYLKNGKIASGGDNPWRAAWTGLDLDNALVPVRLAAPGDSLDKATLENALAGDVQVFAALRDRHNAKHLVLAVAEPAGDGKRLVTRFYGRDSAGPIAMARKDPLHGRDTGETAKQAASIALRILEGRWKLSRSPGSAEEAGPAVDMTLTVEFAGLKQWQAIRARLKNVPGLQALQVSALSARSAEVALRYPGGAQRLQQALASHDLVLHESGGAWILRSN